MTTDLDQLIATAKVAKEIANSVTDGKWEIQVSPDVDPSRPELDGNWPYAYRVGTADSTKALAHVLWEEDARLMAYSKDMVPELADAVIEFVERNEILCEKLDASYRLAIELIGEITNSCEDPEHDEQLQVIAEELAVLNLGRDPS